MWKGLWIVSNGIVDCNAMLYHETYKENDMKVEHEQVKLTLFERYAMKHFEELGYSMRITNLFNDHCFWCFERDGRKMPNIWMNRECKGNRKNYLRGILIYLEQYAKVVER